MPTQSSWNQMKIVLKCRKGFNCQKVGHAQPLEFVSIKQEIGLQRFPHTRQQLTRYSMADHWLRIKTKISEFLQPPLVPGPSRACIPPPAIWNVNPMKADDSWRGGDDSEQLRIMILLGQCGGIQWISQPSQRPSRR